MYCNAYTSTTRHVNREPIDGAKETMGSGADIAAVLVGRGALTGK
jgi:hypothetical protein